MQKKQGISLIVLVITIIIMIILASAVIISLNNNGIITRANEAVDKTNEKQVEELASVAWAGAYADNVGKSEVELLQTLKDAVDKALEDNNIDKADYGIVVTISGVTVAKGWLQTKDRTVVKGDTVLNIGDYVNYISGVEGYTDTNGWQVLGAENGALLILSASNVATKSFNEEGTLEGAIEAYKSAVTDLNEICVPYGEGKNAIGARSITVEDVDRVTGYDKITYGKDKLQEYGNVVTYSFNGTLNPSYLGTNEVSGELETEHSNGFCWLDEKGVYHKVSESDLLSNKEGIITENGVEAKIKSTSYGYNMNSENLDLKEKVPNAYNMLFDDNNSSRYWLATTFVNGYRTQIGYGIYRIKFDTERNTYTVAGGDCFRSTGNFFSSQAGVRAVIQLSQDATLTGSSDIGWTIQ